MEMCCEEADFVIDNGAASFVPLSNYLTENAHLDAGRCRARVCVHSVITGGQAADTINGFKPKPPLKCHQTSGSAWGGGQNANTRKSINMAVFQAEQGLNMLAVKSESIERHRGGRRYAGPLAQSRPSTSPAKLLVKLSTNASTAPSQPDLERTPRATGIQVRGSSSPPTIPSLPLSPSTILCRQPRLKEWIGCSKTIPGN